MKLLFLDCEAGGTDTDTAGLLSLSGLIEIDGVIVEEFDWFVQPFEEDVVEDGALNVNGIKRENISTFEKPEIVYKRFSDLLDKYVDKYNKHDKFYLVGQHIKYDYDLLTTWFQKNGDKYFYSRIFYYLVDLMNSSIMFKLAGIYDFENLKQETISKVLGMQYNAHKSIDDVKQTRKIFYHYINRIKELR